MIRERISKKNKKGKSYQVIIKYKDRYGMRKTYYKSGFERKRDAENHETLMKSQLLEGNDINIQKYTFDEVFTMFIESRSNIKESTRNIYQHTYDLHLKNSLGKYDIDKVDNILINEIFNKIDSALQYKKMMLLIVNYVYSFAYESLLINKQMHFKVRFEKAEKKSYKPVDDDVYNDFLIYLAESKSKYKEVFKLACQIGYYTGMRLGEVFALNNKDIDLMNDTINISKTLNVDRFTREVYISTPKTIKSADSIPIVKPLHDILAEYMDNHPYETLITIDGNYINPQRLGNLMAVYSKKNGVKIHFHQFRHGMATKLCLNDVSPKVAQRILRHSNIKTTLDIYTHINNELMKESLDEMFVDTLGGKKVAKSDTAETYN